MLHPQKQIVGYSEEDIDRIREAQLEYFRLGGIRSAQSRLDALDRLFNELTDKEASLLEALADDLGKPEFEAYAAEIGLVKGEIKFAKRNLKSWMKPKKVKTPMALMPAKSYKVAHPLGRTLIVGPWNYPIQLTLVPLIGSISAGNTAIVKPSELAPASSRIICEIIAASFPPELVAAFEGGVALSQALLKKRWDHIFFTGSTRVGQVVAKAAAETMSPTTLELGGKSPVFITENANLAVAVKRIIYGKFFNAGQTCVSPDYLLVHDSLQSKLVPMLIAEIKRVFGEQPENSRHFARIINERNLHRLLKAIDKEKIVCGGTYDESSRYLAPTLLDKVSWNDEIMKDEIFGPILPVMYYSDLAETVATVEMNDSPLAAYIFSESKDEQKFINDNLRFGGGCINDTMLHVATHNLPFGGVGFSGIGAYHGKYSFDAFSHYKGIVDNPTFIDVPVRYPPYSGWKQKIAKMMLG